MNKYIPVDKLIAEIESRMGDCKLPDGKFPTTTNIVRYEELSCLRDFIISLQKEQPELPGIEEPGIPGKDFIPVEWVDACEMYGKWKIVKQELSEADLDKLVNEEFASHCRTTVYGLEATYNRAELYQLIKRMALVFNARKED